MLKACLFVFIVIFTAQCNAMGGWLDYGANQVEQELAQSAASWFFDSSNSNNDNSNANDSSTYSMENSGNDQSSNNTDNSSEK